MTTNKLINILYTVPYDKLTDGIIYCRINDSVDVVSSIGRVDIDFMRDNTCIGFIRVFGNNTINPVFPERSEYITAMEHVIAYLEIIGFKRDNWI